MSTAALAELDTEYTEADEPDSGRAGYKHLTTQQIGQVLQLAQTGVKQEDIARAVGCGQATVSRTLADLGDARAVARAVLEAGSVKMAQTVVRTKDAGIALKALGKLDVVREDAAGAGTQVLVMLGNSELPLAPPSITVEALSPTDSLCKT